MRHSSRHGLVRFALLPAAAAVALALAGCGGGGGGGIGTAATSLSGQAIDAPVAGATITITSGAPLADGGTSIGTITANSQGGYSITVTLPGGSVPIFANAAAPGTNLELASYLGQSDALSAAGALTTSNLPDLDISPVTTAALAVYAASSGGGSYSGLTPALYASTLATYRNDILAIAAAVKAVGDNLCTPAQPVSTTTDLALNIAKSATLGSANGSSTTLATAASVLGGTCPSVLPTLQTAILADEHFGPELDLGDLIEANVQSVLPGTYALESVIAETPVLQTINTSTVGSAGAASTTQAQPASVFTDTSVTIDASGNVTSTDHAVKGTLVGNLLSLSITDAAGNSYQLRTKVGSLPTALTSGVQAYNVQGGGVNTSSNVLTLFNADLVPVSGGAPAAPLWGAYWTGTLATHMSTEDSGVRGCSAGSLPLRFDVSSLIPGSSTNDDGFAPLAECLASTSATSWTMTASTGNSFEDYQAGSWTTTSGATLTQGGSSSVVWNEVSAPQSVPYVMQASSVTLTATPTATPISGTAYYVLGSRSVVLSSSTSGAGSAILSLQGRMLSQLSESSRNSSDGEQSSVQGDH